jgi:hypothetical protein
MEWLLIFGGLLIVVVIISVMSSSNKKKKMEESARSYTTAIQIAKEEILAGTSSASFPVLNASNYQYRPLRKSISWPCRKARSEWK